MISYKPFWETLKDSGATTYTLIKEEGISSSTINRLRHNKPISTETINKLCRVLNCACIDQIVEFESDADMPLLRAILRAKYKV